jgi:hypothetical protein
LAPPTPVSMSIELPNAHVAEAIASVVRDCGGRAEDRVAELPDDRVRFVYISFLNATFFLIEH